jgi:hypothetical protein
MACRKREFAGSTNDSLPVLAVILLRSAKDGNGSSLAVDLVKLVTRNLTFRLTALVS